MLSSDPVKVIGVGSPIMDLLALVPDAHLERVSGAKGGMELVDHAVMREHLAQLPSPPQTAPGGSAANTVFALAQLNMPAAFLGKIGQDEHAEAYLGEFQRHGGDNSRFKRAESHPTALCLSLITPDSQRTMRTFLGAASTMEPHEVTAQDFEGHGHAHIEGYLLFNRDLMYAVLDAAKAAGCTISLSLGSFEVVNAARDILPEILENYVDMVFANEDEARAFAGVDDLDEALGHLGRHCRTVAITLGPDGALLLHEGETHRAPAHPAEAVVDTTGAGDLWAAGFLFGLLNGHSLAAAAHCAAVLGSLAVQRVGASLDEEAVAHAVDRMLAVVASDTAAAEV
ncbi:MAG: putative sugar kinase YdjH [Candidatus Hydrogenedentota bacterium]|jgi:sugar/nucleoside kinase (ribokinase family)